MAFLGGVAGAEYIGLDDRNLSTRRDNRSAGWPLSFSADGAVLAYRLAEEKGQRGCVVVNGRESPTFDGIGYPFMSRDGRVIAYRAERDDMYFIRINDRDEPACDNVTDPAISADGAIVAYAGERDGHWFLKVGEKQTPISSKPFKVFISDNGRDVGWVETQPLPEGGSKMRVVAFGKTGETFNLIGTPVFSPAGPLAAYSAEDGTRLLVVIGDRKIETPDRISDPVFSPDGRKVGYGARIGNQIWWKVIDIP